MGAVTTQPATRFKDVPPFALESFDHEQAAVDSATLREVYGPRWVLVPHGLGARAARARDAIGNGLIPIDVDRSDPVRVTQEVGEFARTTSKMTQKMLDHSIFISEALGTDVAALPLRRLRRLCNAIVRLSATPPVPPEWSNPAAARKADVVLAALGDDLRRLGDLRRTLFEEFTDDVWRVSGRRIGARRELAAVTRSGRAPTDAKRAVGMVREARELTAAVEASWGTISLSLGHFVAGGVADVDGAVGALAAVIDLHRALGDSLDRGALRALAAADAFVADELVRPARAIAAVVDAWELRANRFGGVDPTQHSASELSAWAREMHDSLTTLRTLKDATAPLRASIRTAGHILEDAVRRDRIHRLCEATTEAISA